MRFVNLITECRFLAGGKFMLRNSAVNGTLKTPYISKVRDGGKVR